MNQSHQTTFKLYFSINRQSGSFLWILLKLNKKSDHLEKNTEELLKLGKKFFNTEPTQNFLFCGEMRGNPLGTALLEETGNILIPLSFAETSAGFPWILIDLPYAMEECIKQNARTSKPVGEVQSIEALLLTENELHSTEESHIGA